MHKKDRDLFELWQSFDSIKKEIVLYLTLLPSPVSIDTLVSLSEASVISLLNAIGKLKAKNIVVEKRGKERGFYCLNSPDPAGFIKEYVTGDEARRALAKITEFYQTASDSIEEAEIVNLAELYLKIGISGDGLPIVKHAADILSRSGQDEKAVAYYDQCLRAMADESLSGANVDRYLDCVLGRISLLIYHMSAPDELSLLVRAKDAAHRFKRWDRLAKIEIVMAQILQTMGQHKRALRCFSNFRNLANRAGDTKTVKSAILTTCEFLFWKGMFSEVVSHYENMVGSLEEFGGDEASLKAAALVGYCFVICGRIARGMGMIEAVRAKGVLLNLQQVVIFTDQMMVLSLFEIRRTSEAEPYLDRLHSLPEDSLGHLISRAINDEKAFLLCRRGEYKEAFEYHQKGVLHARSLGWKHQCGPWVFEYLHILESKGFVDQEVNYDSEIRRLVRWDDLRMKGAAFRYRAKRNLERNQSLRTALSDLKTSERYLEQAGAEIELARTRIEMGRYFLPKDAKIGRAYLEKAWAVMSRVDKNLFPKDLMATMPEERKLEVVVERMIQIDESLGTIRDQGAFLEKVIEVAMDFVMATRGTFIVLEPEGELKQVVSRNLDPLFSDTDRFTMVKTLIADAAQRELEIVFPPQSAGDPFPWEEGFQVYEKVFRQAGIHSFIGMPARLAGGTHGYLCLDNRLGGEPFSHNQLPLVRFLCSQISVGLSNLDTYREMRELKDRFEEEATFYKKEMGIAAPTDIVGGRSEGMREVVERIRQVAPTDSAVLITGETGVGKELVAKAIHNLSDRNAGPFIPVNLAAIPSELMASELFGHEKGAFTGAHQAQKGRFELAHGGTIFLDEIGDLPLTIQVKLLRVLQERTFERLGNAQAIRSDFRVIAATNKDLREEVEKGFFRQDLYYRLDVFPIHVPPLRERKEDIHDLTRHFIEKFGKKLGRHVARIPRGEMKKLVAHTWPGNVRELEHRVEQALIVCDGSSISFPDPVRPKVGGAGLQIYGSEIMTLEELERDYIQRILNLTHWKVMGKGGAASILGMKPTTLFYRMKKLGIGKSSKLL
jgi:transcriptional regulator with GAF, ATPase, and Fis domain/tetratricopeptide (TPR) repeat protein